ncbi:ATP-binding protein [Verminephrobacter aporrectodeae subsp. tuberculatae]|uniref:ATP-binding protein n=1 Tax=Verminephrobacter aporrectodeae TaxID=1110389 RepID=UPI0022371AF1|nr:ATP-binding protein [Verminephrobacter aporrectodeae]MCW5220354.1 ATP-binding protein [Verminephrobacter aporrectodeae subsp. tuberculatae]MCW5289650.1 ATP-binding protein [Verminephrobacter aporrectodeae subsp. tuberculatae]MCW8207884.1 ATP-binding protein [Verminephrobacter aporrectodeae subsp. tuberculatae]
MALDAWLPIGFKLPDGAKSRVTLFGGRNWQILETQGDGRALVAHDDLGTRWMDSGLIELGAFSSFDFGERRLWAISCGPSQVLCPVADGKSPDTKTEALAFAMALKATRSIDTETPLQDALYVEKISRLLPTYSISSRTDDDVVLGYWLTGGASVSAKSFRRLRQTMSWLGARHLKDVVQAASFEVAEVMLAEPTRTAPATQEAVQSDRQEPQKGPPAAYDGTKVFELAGRPELAAFFNEHVIDIVQHRDRYKALGIDFPSAIVLHGPPGCGKTFAIDRLVDFLGWPSFQIDASSVASPYIHGTSKKVAEVFDKAMQNAPSVLVIDEMEAFFADREMGSGHHRVEEVAEFLRRIPEATKNEVLIVAMTNRVDMIDPAILRRGRFDYVIKVDFASEIEVLSLLEKLLSTLPRSDNVDLKPFTSELAGRPLSDVAFVVREGARLAARSGKDKLDQKSLLAAMESAPAREREGGQPRRICFI